MKNPHYEHLGRRMREYHRSHAWRLSEGGLFIPHSYQEMGPDSLSYVSVQLSHLDVCGL